MKSFDQPVRMLNINPTFGNFRVAFLFFLGQRILFRGLHRNRTVLVNVLNPDKTFVRQSLRFCTETNPALAKQTEIVFSSPANRYTDNSPRFRVDHDQQFQGMSLLFAGIVSFLFFLGRSVSHSVTSRMTTSMESSPNNALFDGR